MMSSTAIWRTPPAVRFACAGKALHPSTSMTAPACHTSRVRTGPPRGRGWVISVVQLGADDGDASHRCRQVVALDGVDVGNILHAGEHCQLRHEGLGDAQVDLGKPGVSDPVVPGRSAEWLAVEEDAKE